MKALVLTVLLALAQPVAATDRDPFGEIEAGWAAARFATDSATQVPQIDRLIARTEALAAQQPRRAAPLVWRGVLLATKASIVRGLSGFSLVRQARDQLETAERIDPLAENGLGLMQLGIIYGAVPGPPLAFGDRKKARSYFERAVAADPAGLAANLAFADFLVKGGRFAEAEPLLLTALRAAPRPDQPVADAGRRAEAMALLRLTRTRLGRG